jgi:hypothetical protein
MTVAMGTTQMISLAELEQLDDAKLERIMHCSSYTSRQRTKAREILRIRETISD